MKRIIVTAFVVCVASLLMFLSDALRCFIVGCVVDDAALMADSMVGPFMISIYFLVTVIFVFLPAVYLNRKVAKWVSCFIPSLLTSVLFSSIFYTPKIDSFVGLAAIFLWFLVPWAVASFIGLALWPNKSFNGTALRAAR